MHEVLGLVSPFMIFVYLFPLIFIISKRFKTVTWLDVVLFALFCAGIILINKPAAGIGSVIWYYLANLTLTVIFPTRVIHNNRQSDFIWYFSWSAVLLFLKFGIWSGYEGYLTKFGLDGPNDPIGKFSLLKFIWLFPVFLIYLYWRDRKFNRFKTQTQIRL